MSNSISGTPVPSPRKVKTANKSVQVVDLSDDNKPPIEDIRTEVIDEEETEEVVPPEDSLEKQLQLQREWERRDEEDRKRLEEDERKQRERDEAARILSELDSGGLHQESDEERKRQEEEVSV